MRRRLPIRKLVLVAALLAGACAGPERPIIEQFFSASRLRDRTALQPIATVLFEPRERGIVTRFEVVKVETRAGGSPEHRDVTIAAPVAMPDGRTIQKTLVISMERDKAGRWIVTAVDDSVSRP